MSVVYLNGEFLEEKDAKVSINDSGYYYGDGFYEVIFLYNGKLIDRKIHIERLMKNFSKLYFKNYPSENEILTIIDNVIKKNQKQNGAIYIQCTRGCTQRTHEFYNLNLKPNIVVKINEISNNCFSNEIPKWHCKMIEDPRRLNCEIKMISLLPMVLAKLEAEKDGFDDVIFYNSRCNSVTEGTSFNIFIVQKDGKIITCPNGNQILPGCTRARIIDIIKSEKLNFEERFFSKEELYNAKEVFLTASLKINSIIKVNENLINEGKAGETTIMLRNKYLDFINSNKND
jgi:D-alanine transaminase